MSKPKRAGRWRPPTMEECTALADAMPSKQLRAFVLLSAWSGLRLSEVAALQLADLSLGAVKGGPATLHVRAGKGNVEGWSLLYPAGVEALDAALEEDMGDARMGAPLLYNRRHEAWNRKSVNKAWVKARASVPGQESTIFHDLRKAHATWLLDEGASEMDVAMQLRHISKHGHPNSELVRRVYGFPSVDAALDRLRVLSSGAVSS